MSRLDVEPSRGRPRDSARDVAILDATLGLLTEVGYERLSIESVAAKAGVGKTTIYRRYPDKASLVAASIEHRGAAQTPVITRGGLRHALLVTVGWLAELISGQDLVLFTAVSAGRRADPQLEAAVRDIHRRDLAMLTDLAFSRAGDEQLSTNARELFAELTPAVILNRVLAEGKPCDRRFVTHLVDDVLLPLLRRRPPGTKEKKP